MNSRPPLILRLLRFLTRRLYPLQGSGLPRLAEWIRRTVASTLQRNNLPTDYWISDFAGQSRFCCDLGDHMGSLIFFRGAYSQEQLQLLPELLADGSVFVDVGANQGEFSVFAAALPRSVQVFAFEPVSDVRARLEENISANLLHNVRIFPIGLSSEARSSVPIFGSSERFSDGTRHAGLPTLFTMEHREKVLEYIKLETLDHVLEESAAPGRIALIKIDVEGAELHVIKGAQCTIAADRPHILFEVNDLSAGAAGYSTQDLFDWFDNTQYTLQQVLPSGGLGSLDRQIPFGNVLATPNEKFPASSS